MSDPHSPPTYAFSGAEPVGGNELQVLITPSTGSTRFQNGYLGADEHCSIEGEVQIKSAAENLWDKIMVVLRTVESFYDHEVELTRSELCLWTNPRQSTSSSISSSPPPSLPFSIPLTRDLPQAVTTPSSSITHTLEARLFPVTGDIIVKSTQIEIVRYSAGRSAADLPIDPVNFAVHSPAPATLQIPRTAYRAGEPIPLYITIPPPEEVTMLSGVRLRNIRAELIREIRVGDLSGQSAVSEPPQASTSSAFPAEKSDPVPGGVVHHSVLSRSGAACRFHLRRPVKVRLVLHDNDNAFQSSGSITQTTVLHQVSFHVKVAISYTSPAHSSTTSNIALPVVIIPAFAPAREGDFSEEVDIAYQKKHDPPPVRTNRIHDDNSSGLPPSFDELPHQGGLPGPSHVSLADHSSHFSSPYVPPPPSFSEASVSSSSAATSPPSFDEAAAVRRISVSIHPPSFDESSRDHHPLPSFDDSLASSSTPTISAAPSALPSLAYWVNNSRTDSLTLHFSGEGELYGFPPSEQYDGLSHSMILMAGAASQSENPAAVPPHVLFSDVTEVPSNPPPGIDESIAAGIASAFAPYLAAAATDSDDRGDGESGDEEDDGDASPPPPPALDDPSDLPPTIDDGVPVHELTDAQWTARQRAIVEAAVVHAQLQTAPGGLEGDGSSTAMQTASVHLEEHYDPPPYLGAHSAVAVAVAVAANQHHRGAPGGGPPPYVG